MQRLDRNNRSIKDLGIFYSENAHIKFENDIKAMFRLNTDEYEFIVANVTPEEMDLLIQKKNYTYSEKRKVIGILDDYLTEFEERKQNELEISNN